MVTLTIDGKEIQAEEGSTILEVAREKGIEIPSLCYHEAIAPHGTCRLCLVEIGTDSRSKLVASCLHSVEEGLKVRTNSEKVLNARRAVVKLLLERCPSVKVLHDLARQLDIEEEPSPSEDTGEECILCTLCTRVCQEVVGIGAISLVNKGTKRKGVATFEDPSKACIGCGSCVYICPTGAIKMEDVGGTRIIHNWKAEFKLKRCRVCNNYFVPERQLEYIREKVGLAEDLFERCPDCRD